jgi:glutathione S-transferase
MALTLYVDRLWESPYVYSCFVTLKEKAVPFAVEEIALETGANKSKEYQDKTIWGRVPAIVHDGFGLAESQAIIDYLEDAFPNAPHVLPRDVKERARARAVLGWIRSDLLDLRAERPTTSMFFDHAVKPLTPAGRAAVDRLFSIANRLLPAGKTQLFSEWSIADADLALMLHRLILNDDDVPKNLAAFAETQWKRPSVEAFVNHARPEWVPH